MSADFKITGSSAGAVKAIDDLNKILDEAAESAEGVTKASKRMTDQAQRIKESLDPQAKYNRQLEDLKKHVQANTLSLEEAQRKAMKYGETLARAGDAGNKTFGSQALQNVGQMAMAITGISSAWEVALGALRSYEAEKQKAADAAVRSRQGVGQLAQLAASDKNPDQAYKDLVEESNEYWKMGAAGDLGEAATLTFDLAAAGLEKKDREFAARMRASGTLTNVGGLAGAYDAARTSMGVAEVGSFEQFTSKALAAGAAAPGTVDQLPVALSRAMGSAKTLGLSDESVFAAGAILAKQRGSSSEGGTQMAALLSGIEKSGIDVKGMTFTQMIERLSTENTGAGGIFKDNQESIAAFRTISANLEGVKGLEGSIFAAQNQALSETAVDLPNTDPDQRAANSKVESENRRAEQLKLFARAEVLRETAINNWVEKRRAETSGWSRAGAEWDIGMTQLGTTIPLFGNAETHLQQIANTPKGAPGYIGNEDTLEQIRNLLKEIAESGKGTEQNTSELNGKRTSGRAANTPSRPARP